MACKSSDEVYPGKKEREASHNKKNEDNKGSGGQKSEIQVSVGPHSLQPAPGVNPPLLLSASGGPGRLLACGGIAPIFYSHTAFFSVPPGCPVPLSFLL
ncbi:unnamed protein product [Nyctereutes procyonoides]|uniref:(raccoon dog) hypothetical protein n=1 Tax=Nyctereutes procyonoides TaxID=34880 RepID=A0A811YVW9_NYCPR|nr:unnamed protein product [Nyctereutes procyonoides]